MVEVGKGTLNRLSDEKNLPQYRTKSTISYLEEYQEYIKSLKKENYSVRESKEGKETEDTHVKLLQLMCNCLRNRSLVDCCVFVSCSCNASDTLHSRDKSQVKVLEDGNTRGNLKIYFYRFYVGFALNT
ncbi:hypothetical protein BD770DRAFT_426656 [Pilaira anomala]|nr:hypothetical protein BD770DRAFT_426656 [Pilaira anomala]